MENKPLFRFKTIDELHNELGSSVLKYMSTLQIMRAGNIIPSDYNSEILDAFLHNKQFCYAFSLSAHDTIGSEKVALITITRI